MNAKVEAMRGRLVCSHGRPARAGPDWYLFGCGICATWHRRVRFTKHRRKSFPWYILTFERRRR